MLNHHRTPTVTVLGPILLAALGGALAGCQSSPRHAEEALAPAANVPITLDGDIAEWPEDSAVAADERYFYFRVKVEGESFPLQAGPQTLALLLDVDGDAATGRGSALSPLHTLGIDMEVQFSPLKADGTGAEHGVAAFIHGSDGSRTRGDREVLDVSVAPTYAAGWFEGRLSRHVQIAGDPTAFPPVTGLASEGRVAGLFALLDAGGEIVGYSDPFELHLPGVAATRTFADADLPPKPEGAVRVLSYNVKKSSPVAKPDAFARIIEAIAPDVVLVQEWEQGGATELEGWFTAMVGTDDPWRAHKAPGGEVGIVARGSVEAFGPGTVEIPGATGQPRAVRVVMARVATRSGDLVVASAHLKCCGTIGGSEDEVRMAEARAINAAFAGALAAAPAPYRVIAGDLNLVGSRPPLDLLRTSLDADGTDLGVAEAFVLGDRAQYTWSSPGDTFPPGRLDYLVYSDSSAEVVNAFVLDTTRLSDAALARIGLDRDDTLASDHLPLVVDLRAR